MLLSLLLAWALVTGASAVALLLFLAFDEWQVRTRAAGPTAPADQPTGDQPTGDQPTADQSTVERTTRRESAPLAA